MNESTNPTSFVFNSLIDPDTIYSLYENDYQYIEEIFHLVLTNFEGDLDQVLSAYNAGDLESLRKGVHKIKPTFGFLGMLSVEQKCRQVEDKCKSSQDTKELSADMEELHLLLNQAKKVIEEDHKRLINYNKA